MIGKRTDSAALEQAIANWLAVRRDEIPWDQLDCLNLIGSVEAAEVSVAMRSLRRLVFALLRHVDEGRQVVITDFLKHTRKNKVEQPLAKMAASYRLSSIYQLKSRLQSAGVAFPETRGAVCITHDVDWIECQKFTPDLAAFEERCGIRSTFNFLTHWNYKLDKALVADLARAGFEIGLHGAEHDIALAYRSREKICVHLRRALDVLPVPVKGFRSPALSSSQTLLAALDELGFAYDSSLATRDMYGEGLDMCFPYLYPELKLWEIPLTLQDSTLFRDLGLRDGEAADIVLELMHEVVEMGGVFVFNGHPGILRNHMEFYRSFVERAVDCDVLTMEEIVHCWKGRQRVQPRSI